MAFPLLAKKRIVVILLVLFGVLYFLLPSTHPPHTSELSHPEYALLPPGGQIIVGRDHTLSLTKQRPHVVFPVQPVFVSSFFVTSDVVQELLSRDAHYAGLISADIAQSKNASTNSTVFDCICGRVSDVCVCCGSLSIPKDVCESGLPSRLCGPLVLFSTVATDAARLCLNITYLPKKQHVNTAGFLVPETVSSGQGRMGQLADSSSGPPIPFSHTLVLFDNQVFPINVPFVLCIENSRTDPQMAICFQFHNLRYFYDTGSDHKTVFAGCGQVSTLLKRQFIVTSYPPFCFRAHRGAAGDVDQAAALVSKETKNLKVNGTGSIMDSPDSALGRKVSKDSAAVAPVPESPKKLDSKKVAGSLDAHDAFPVVP